MELPVILNILMYDIITMKALYIYATHENVGEQKREEEISTGSLILYP